MKTIANTVIAANAAALDIRLSSVWNYYKAQFTNTSRIMKDANELAQKLAFENTCAVTVYAVTAQKGRSAHSKTEMLLIALPAGHEIDSCGRRVRTLTSVRKGG